MEFSSFKSILWLFFLAGTFISDTTALSCPTEKNIIFPCFCLQESPQDDLQIRCDGPINQTSVDDAFIAVRQQNNLTLRQWLPLAAFTIIDSPLVQLDLTPLLYSRITLLSIDSNRNLSSIVGPPTSEHNRTIDVTNLIIVNTNLTTTGFGNSLQYFTPNLTSLYLFENKLNIGAPNSLRSELLPGLSALENVQTLALHTNGIQKLTSGSIRITDRLDYLDLMSNDIVEIGENAFDLVEGRVNSLYVVLSDNKNLTEKGIHVNWGLGQSKTREISLFLSACNLATLPREIFEPFLEANDGNWVFVNDNPLICDARVKWAKDRRSEFEHRIYEPFCINDKGHTIFNSTLV